MYRLHCLSIIFSLLVAVVAWRWRPQREEQIKKMVACGRHEFSLEILQLFLNAPCRRSFIREMRENQNEEQKKDSHCERQYDDSHRQTRPIFARFTALARDVNLPTCCWFSTSKCVFVVWMYKWPRRSGDAAVSLLAHSLTHIHQMFALSKTNADEMVGNAKGGNEWAALLYSMVYLFSFSPSLSLPLFLSACYLSWVVDNIGFCSNLACMKCGIRLERYLRLFRGVTKSFVKQKALTTWGTGAEYGVWSV